SRDWSSDVCSSDLGIAHAPGAVPAQDVLRLCDLPQREVGGVALVFADVLADSGLLILNLAVGELAELRPACHVEIDVSGLGDVGVALLDETLDHLDLLGDVAAGARA